MLQTKNSDVAEEVVVAPGKKVSEGPKSKSGQIKFIVSSSSLLKHLQTIGGVLNANNPLPILDNFLFAIEKGSLTISASDLETTMITRLAVESKASGKV